MFLLRHQWSRGGTGYWNELGGGGVVEPKTTGSVGPGEAHCIIRRYSNFEHVGDAFIIQIRFSTAYSTQ